MKYIPTLKEYLREREKKQLEEDLKWYAVASLICGALFGFWLYMAEVTHYFTF